MALRLGRVTVPETELAWWDSDLPRTDGATGQWSAALAPGQVGQSERGAAGTAPARRLDATLISLLSQTHFPFRSTNVCGWGKKRFNTTRCGVKSRRFSPCMRSGAS